MQTYSCYDTYNRWDDCVWREAPENVGLPKPARVIGRRYNRHDSITPPLDFRLCLVSRFDPRHRRCRPRIKRVHSKYPVHGERVRLDERAWYQNGISNVFGST